MKVLTYAKTFGLAMTLPLILVLTLCISGNLSFAMTLQEPHTTLLSPGITSRVSLPDMGSEANADSRFPAISADGRYVAFQSFASNMVHGDENSVYDIFVRDRQVGRTYLVSATPRGEGAISTLRSPPSPPMDATSPSHPVPATWSTATGTPRMTSSSAICRADRPGAFQ
jgi:hypothetical protein